MSLLLLEHTYRRINVVCFNEHDFRAAGGIKDEVQGVVGGLERAGAPAIGRHVVCSAQCQSYIQRAGVVEVERAGEVPVSIGGKLGRGIKFSLIIQVHSAQVESINPANRVVDRKS